MAGRLYVVENDDEMTLVRANSQGQALNHVMKGKFTVRAASPDDVLEYVTAGGVVEDVNGETPAAGEGEAAAT